MILANKPDQWIEPIDSINTKEVCLPPIDFYRSFASFRAQLFLLSQEFSINIFLSVEIFKEFLEDAYEVLPYPLPCCRNWTHRCTRSHPPRWQSCFPKRPFAQSFRDIDSKAGVEEECGPKWPSKRKAAVLAVPLASRECRPSLGGSSSQLRKSPHGLSYLLLSASFKKIIATSSTPSLFTRQLTSQVA